MNHPFFLFEYAFLELKNQAEQSCVAGGGITGPNLCFTTFVLRDVKCAHFMSTLGYIDFLLCTEVA